MTAKDELIKLGLEEWDKFTAEQKKRVRYKYNELEKDTFMSGFIRGATAGLIIYEKLSIAQKELKKNDGEA